MYNEGWGTLGARAAAHGGLRQALHGVAVRADVHDGHAGDFADASLQVAVARRDDVALVLRAERAGKGRRGER
jgi:hypothetical protein